MGAGQSLPLPRRPGVWRPVLSSQEQEGGGRVLASQEDALGGGWVGGLGEEEHPGEHQGRRWSWDPGILTPLRQRGSRGSAVEQAALDSGKADRASLTVTPTMRGRGGAVCPPPLQGRSLVFVASPYLCQSAGNRANLNLKICIYFERADRANFF